MTQDLLTTFIEANWQMLLTALIWGWVLAAAMVYETGKNSLLRVILAVTSALMGFFIGFNLAELVTPIPDFIVGVIVLGTAVLGVGLYSAVILMIMLTTESRQTSETLGSRMRN